MFEPIRFVWNATRGSRLRPWRSEYLRWRVETYTGQWAGRQSLHDVLRFMWNARWELLSFLWWTGQVQREARRRP